MTQDEIIRMAREAGLIQYVQVEKTCVSNALERFATLVAAHEREKIPQDFVKACEVLVKEKIEAVLAEREACAKVCDERANSYKYATDPWAHEHIAEANTCAATIRVRGEK